MHVGSRVSDSAYIRAMWAGMMPHERVLIVNVEDTHEGAA
jgi:hypothetical protein